MRASVLTLASLILILAGCGGGGGGGGGGNDGSGATGAAPTVDPIPDVAAPEEDPVYVMGAPTGSDPDGDPLTWSWSIKSGSTTQAVEIFDTNSSTGTASFRFPKNGPYTIRVSASDGNGNTTTREFAIIVDDPNPFSIDGEVSDDGMEKAGLVCELFFQPVGESEVVDNDSTNGSGAFQFDDLIGDKDQFIVLVPGS